MRRTLSFCQRSTAHRSGKPAEIREKIRWKFELRIDRCRFTICRRDLSWSMMTSRTNWNNCQNSRRYLHTTTKYVFYADYTKVFMCPFFAVAAVSQLFVHAVALHKYPSLRLCRNCLYMRLCRINRHFCDSAAKKMQKNKWYKCFSQI